MLQIEQSTVSHHLFVSKEIERLVNTVIEKIEGAKGDKTTTSMEKDASIQDDKSQPNPNLPNFTIPFARNWQEVFKHWEEGCASKNLMEPLKNMSCNLRKGKRRKKVRSVYSDRKLIATES